MKSRVLDGEYEERMLQKNGVRVPSRWLIAALCTLGVSGCIRVAAYDRERLAHRTMAPGFGETRAQEHVRAVHEGATGGVIGVSSGCGCN